MTRWFGPFATLIVAAIGAHWATLAFAPNVIMDRALSTLKNRGIAEHAFTTPQRIMPQTQAVVRSSPDLFYSLCRFDLSERGSELSVTMGEWPDYQSLSFFDAETNNFLTLRGTGKSVSQTVYFHAPPPDDAIGVQAPTKRGVVLIRRLAPTQKAFAAAAEAAKADACNIR
ncbi:MAG: DUF1254 domain-containing protein [Erythrobacter sp.]|uniref:DUF1254 domain-containing protein n=1 Tax=Erythrobacter sp. TaxID=1042 RepID=UPI002606C67C|nr:DUF1254 domain-containing protein [Erythrobacter sp.]MDJ0979187.1 DUF1254 domain-containing protein [Erythrobacter sp.]